MQVIGGRCISQCGSNQNLSLERQSKRSEQSHETREEFNTLLPPDIRDLKSNLKVGIRVVGEGEG